MKKFSFRYKYAVGLRQHTSSGKSFHVKKRAVCVVLTLILALGLSFPAFSTSDVSANDPIISMDWEGHAYSLYDLSMTWEEAKAFCESLGGHLVTITSVEEQSLIEGLLEYGSQKQYWIGLSCSSGSMRWVTGEALTYTNWDNGEPNANMKRGFKEQYVHILNTSNPAVRGSKRFKWNDIYNDNTFPDEEDNFALQYVGLICECDEITDQYKENRVLIDAMCRTPATEYNRELAEIAAELAFKTYDDGMRDDTSVRNYLHYELGFDWDNIRSYSAVLDYSGGFSFRFRTVDGYGDYFSFTAATRDYGDAAVLVIIAQGTSEIIKNEGIYDKLTGTSEINGYTVFDVVRDFYSNIYNNLDSVADGSKEYKVLLTGHSLGGAAVNWAAGQLMDGHNDKARVAAPLNDVYCYTFGALNSFRSDTLVESGYENIHNVYNELDELYSGALLGGLANLGNGMFEKNGKFGVLDMFRYDYSSPEAKGNPNVRLGEVTPNHSNYLEAVKSGRIIRVFVDGKRIAFNDVPPYIKDGRTLVPIRKIAEALGAEVEWNPLNREVFITKGNIVLTITIGDNLIYRYVIGQFELPSPILDAQRKGDIIELDVPAEIVDGRTFLPLRAVSEGLGCRVEWSEETKAALIFSEDN